MSPQDKVDRNTLPSFLYGTAWKEDDTKRCVLDALSAGFRAIDTACQRKHYFEQGVGDAIKEATNSGLVQRQDLFLQTKFTFLAGQDQRLPYDPHADTATQVEQSFATSQKHLGQDTVDSYVLHGPTQRVGLTDTDWEAWHAMEKLVTNGNVKMLGLSNVGLDQIKQIVAHASVKPRFVQNRCYAITGWDKSVREFCKQEGIIYQGFSLLTANRDVLSHPGFQELVQRYGLTHAQLVFAFAYRVGMIPITGTTRKDHMEEDLKGYQRDLAAEDIERLENILL